MTQENNQDGIDNINKKMKKRLIKPGNKVAKNDQTQRRPDKWKYAEVNKTRKNTSRNIRELNKTIKESLKEDIRRKNEALVGKVIKAKLKISKTNTRYPKNNKN